MLQNVTARVKTLVGDVLIDWEDVQIEIVGDQWRGLVPAPTTLPTPGHDEVFILETTDGRSANIRLLGKVSTDHEIPAFVFESDGPPG